jgi:hypothetical protein
MGSTACFFPFGAEVKVTHGKRTRYDKIQRFIVKTKEDTGKRLSLFSGIFRWISLWLY